MIGRACFGLTDDSKGNLIGLLKSSSWQEALVNELLSYAFSPLREGDIALYRGFGTGMAPILLVAAEETSLGSLQRLEQEFALKAELEADWAPRPVPLPPSNAPLPLLLEDPARAPLD